MKQNLLVLASLITFLLWNCGHKSDNKGIISGDNIILQQADGTVSLKLDNAACYSDIQDPSSNTAEWEMSISKTGRYKIWLSSATRDTLSLGYKNAVKIHLLENQLEVNPVCDKIVRNSKDISYPYYQADSYVGSVYIQEPGIYSIQVISEKVLSKELREQTASLSAPTKLMSVILEPLTR